jgi:hypothetical protein
VAKQTPKWFKKIRGSYLPRSWQAWTLYIPYVAYLIGVLVFVFHRHDSFWLAVFTVVPNWVAAGVIMTWLARSRS